MCFIAMGNSGDFRNSITAGHSRFRVLGRDPPHKLYFPIPPMNPQAEATPLRTLLPPASLLQVEPNRLRPLLPLPDLRPHPHAVGQRGQSGPLQGRHMHDQVLAAGIRGDEAETLGRVEPLDGAVDLLGRPDVGIAFPTTKAALRTIPEAAMALSQTRRRNRREINRVDG